MRKLATGMPAPVVRILGSSTALPTIVTYVSFITVLLSVIRLCIRSPALGV
jgi:hypothetical protein